MACIVANLASIYWLVIAYQIATVLAYLLDFLSFWSC